MLYPTNNMECVVRSRLKLASLSGEFTPVTALFYIYFIYMYFFLT